SSSGRSTVVNRKPSIKERSPVKSELSFEVKRGTPPKCNGASVGPSSDRQNITELVKLFSSDEIMSSSSNGHPMSLQMNSATADNPCHNVAVTNANDNVTSLICI